MSELNVYLQIYLGDLIEQYRTTFEWYDKKKLLEKINAVETLLDIQFKTKIRWKKQFTMFM